MGFFVGSGLGRFREGSCLAQGKLLNTRSPTRTRPVPQVTEYMKHASPYQLEDFRGRGREKALARVSLLFSFSLESR